MSTPFFYIIKHIPSNKFYAGYKSKNANPSTFFTEHGYKTSSKVVHNLIHQFGLDSFQIIDIILEDEIMIPFGWNSVYQFETWFLNYNNCADSNDWLNCHNNKSPVGSLDSSGKLKICRESSVLLKYGVTNVSKLESVKTKKINSMIKNFGSFELAMKSKTEKQIEHNLLNYGVEHTFQIPEVIEKQKQSMLDIYGVENASQSPEIKLKKVETCRKNYGVDYYSQTEEAKRKLAERNKLMNSIVRTCPHCNKTGKGNNMFRYHFDNCKLISKHIDSIQ